MGAPPPLPLHRFSAPGGGGVIVAPDPDADVVAVQFWMTAGVVDEPADASGVAHLTEHLLVRAAHRARPALVATGASFDGVTSADHCILRTIVRPPDLGLALHAGAEAFSSSTLHEPIEVERRVLGRELAHHRGSESQKRMAARMTAAFGATHPYARPVAGDPRRIARLDAADVARLREEAHHPRRLVIVVTGKVEPTRTSRLVDELTVLDELPGRRAAPADLPPAGAGGGIALVGRPTMMVGLPGVPACSPDAPLLDMWAYVLSGRLGGGPTGSARSWTARSAGLLLITCERGPERMVEVAEALSLEGPTEAELEGARQTLGAGRRRAPMWVDRTATELGWNETTAGAAEEWTAFHARIRAATPATVAAAGRSRLNWSAASIVVALPNRDAAEGRLDTTRTALGRHS